MDTFDSVDLGGLSGSGSENTLILTVNNRHARRVLAELSAGLGPDRSVMAVPDIVPLSGWLRRLADSLSFLPRSEEHTSELQSLMRISYAVFCLKKKKKKIKVY